MFCMRDPLIPETQYFGAQKGTQSVEMLIAFLLPLPLGFHP